MRFATVTAFVSLTLLMMGLGAAVAADRLVIGEMITNTG